MTPFVMTDGIKAQLQELRKLAEQDDRVLSLEEVKAHANGFDANDPSTRLSSPYPVDQTVELPLGWKVTMSVEYQPVGLTRHMSMSSPVAGRVPTPEAVQWTLLALGFVRPLESCMVYPEQYASGRLAVNVLEPMDPTK
jgi:hypothetical protein